MLLGLWPGYTPEWELRAPVTFDGINRLIIVNPGTTELDVEQDIYSQWKRWAQVRDYSKYPQAMRNVGGDPTVAGGYLGATFFLMNGWKVRTWEGNHRLIVKGNLLSDDGLDPFVPTIEPHNITISLTTSNIVDKVANDEVAKLVWDVDDPPVPGTRGKDLKDILKLIKTLMG